MLQSYDDILAVAREARRPIGWYDENGVPRFAPHHPSRCPDIHATEVALLLISCQSCDREYRVQMSWSLGGEVIARSRGVAPAQSLSARVVSGAVHYGDPPCFHDNCTSGATMNCWDLRVLEFWSRNRAERRYQEAGGTGGWIRLADHEIELPDANDPERRGAPL